jgi:adenine-specific DNA-methyltransferase
MLAIIDNVRREAVQQLNSETRGELGQFMTPYIIAEFLASLFSKSKEEISLLDAGAGAGTLTAAFLERHLTESSFNKKVHVTAYEIDPIFKSFYNRNISKYISHKADEIEINYKNADFIVEAVSEIKENKKKSFTHVIINPPYKKIHSSSNHRKLLSSINLETVNLYSAFTALSIMLLQDGGELVAIIPRSFCNGNYYKSFRKLIFDDTAILQIHLFESRNKAFKEDSVLQENIIIHLKKGAKQNDVIISRSTDGNFEDITKFDCTFDKVRKPNDNELFIHIPQPAKNLLDESLTITHTLAELGLTISTGPVVDFRVKEYISKDAVDGTVPLIYPSHFDGISLQWPKEGKKPNAIELNSITKKMMYPSGFYTVVRRFSSKEEKQRINARVINPNIFELDFIGIENHLNVFHCKKSGLSEDLAYGLGAYLNSSVVDIHFRSFNGHTQVNATDLRQMKYPSKSILEKLGKWAKTLNAFNQDLIDKKIEKLL